jgi:hypothetical protein
MAKYLTRNYASGRGFPDHPGLWGPVVVLCPLLAVVLGSFLLDAINPSSRGTTEFALASHAAVRTAISSEFTKDFSKERLLRILMLVTMSTPTLGSASQAHRVTLEARCAKLDADTKDAECETLKSERDKWEAQRTNAHTIISARLAGETAILADRVTATAMTPHPALDEDVRQGTRTISQVVAQRITSATVLETLERWLQDVLDAEGRAMAVRYIDPMSKKSPQDADHQQAVLGTIAKALVQHEDPVRVVAVVERATTSAFNSYNLGAEAAVWGKDIAGRVTWATAALVFCFALVLLIAASVVQMLRIAPPGSTLFIVATGLAALITLWASFEVDSWLQAKNIPLLKLLTDYSLMFDVRMWAWATSLNALAAVGAVSLIAGTVATFSVGIETDPKDKATQEALKSTLTPDELAAARQLTDEKLKEQLKEQLQGLRMLFNAGSVLLVVAVFEIAALLRWPTFFIAAADAQTAMQSAAATTATAIGALFSVVLLSTYVPATTLLRRQASTIGIPAKDVDQIFRDAGFADLATQQVGRLGQALLPLAPGLVATLLV